MDTAIVCSVPFCYNKSTNSKITFYNYPQDENLRCIWLKNCGIEEICFSNTHKICENHFETKMLLGPSELVPSAIPTLFSDEIIKNRKLEDSQVVVKLETESVNIDFQYQQNSLEFENSTLSNVKNEHSNNSNGVTSTKTNDHFNKTQIDNFSPLLLKTELDDTKSPANFENQFKNDTIANSVIHLKMDTTSYLPNSSFSSNNYYNEEQSTSVPNNSRGEFPPDTEEVKNLRNIKKKLQMQLKSKSVSTFYLKLAKKYLPPDLFEKVKSRIEKQISVFGDF
ncbi:THAP domain-containing protein 11-like [Daktulosphaira vitifoliae]|uniref:THAP domain-containing protein 11-like n=1 Tax=Daktulosphaira vitifoliae TaxID=58002 RepID=UPI0021AACBDC|nr:THAP domain-containing protein 11-like [Daktulosphaira vitifoliae]